LRAEERPEARALDLASLENRTEPIAMILRREARALRRERERGENGG